MYGNSSSAPAGQYSGVPSCANKDLLTDLARGAITNTFFGAVFTLSFNACGKQSIYQDRLGTTIAETFLLKRKAFFVGEWGFEGYVTTGSKTVFFRHLYIKMMILPRQARDKHRETTQKGTVLLQALT